MCGPIYLLCEQDPVLLHPPHPLWRSAAAKSRQKGQPTRQQAQRLQALSALMPSAPAAVASVACGAIPTRQSPPVAESLQAWATRSHAAAAGVATLHAASFGS